MSRVCSVDVGTMFFQVAEESEDGQINIKSIRNAFVELPEDEDVEDILNRNEWQWIKDGKKYYVLGEDSLKVANIFPGKVELRRPMESGVLNKNEEKKMIVLAEIIRSALGKAPDKGSIVCICVSSESVDDSGDSVFHKNRLSGMFSRLGWNVHVIEEGQAVVLSERPTITEKDEHGSSVEVPFSGIGLSFGAGRTNCVLTYKGLKIVGMSCARCLAGDFPVISNNCIKPISEISEGDKIIDGLGQESEVLSLVNNGHKETLLSLRLKRLPDMPFNMTSDHKVFVKRDRQWQWVCANDIVSGDIVGEPIVEFDSTVPQIVHVGMSGSQERIRCVKSRNLGRLCGLFLGDGSTNFNGQGYGYVQWAINRKDRDTIEKYDRILTELLDIDCEIADCDTEGVVRIKAHRTYLAKFFKERFYSLDGVKVCPFSPSEITDQMAIGIIEGLVDSDGMSVKDRYNGFEIYNTSKYIILLAHMLLSRFGIQHSITRRDPRKGGTNKHGVQIEGKKDTWTIRVPALAASLFQSFVAHENHGFYYQKHDFMEYQVDSIETIPYNDDVFDLQVRSSHHSFSSLGMLVHNCGDWIDKKVSDATNTPISQVTRKKERALNFDNLEDFDDSDDVLFALNAYYEELVRFVFEKFAVKFGTVKSQFEYPLPIVVAGGTSMPKGFCNKIKEVVSGLELPFDIKDVIHATEPRNAVVKGCLTAAVIAKRRMDKKEE